jgi:hypothetical protein
VAPRNLLKYKDCGGWYEGLVKIGLLKEIQPDPPGHLDWRRTAACWPRRDVRDNKPGHESLTASCSARSRNALLNKKPAPTPGRASS